VLVYPLNVFEEQSGLSSSEKFSIEVLLVAAYRFIARRL
jgi:hypothetical protein